MIGAIVLLLLDSSALDEVDEMSVVNAASVVVPVIVDDSVVPGESVVVSVVMGAAFPDDSIVKGASVAVAVDAPFPDDSVVGGAFVVAAVVVEDSVAPGASVVVSFVVDASFPDDSVVEAASVVLAVVGGATVVDSSSVPNDSGLVDSPLFADDMVVVGAEVVDALS